MKGEAESPGGERRRRQVPVPALVGVLLVIVLAVLYLVLAQAGVSLDSDAMVSVEFPLDGGSIQRASAVTGPHSRVVPVVVRGDEIYPAGLVRADQRISVDVVVRRPGWISWLAGSTQTLHVVLTTPVASLRSHFVTVASGSPVRLHFKEPIEAFAYGQDAQLARYTLNHPQSVITLPHTGDTGSVLVAAAPRRWETSSQAVVSWFPAGGAATAVASPAPGAQISPSTPITLTFSRPVAGILSSRPPPIAPATQGAWHVVNPHEIQFRPTGDGYGFGARVTVALPTGVKLSGGRTSSDTTSASWPVAAGSTLRLQQILASLDYLPVHFHYGVGAAVGSGVRQQLAAATDPPAGRFSWRYPDTPPALKEMWAPGQSGAMTQGALMAFENDHGLTADGVAGAEVWRALIKAASDPRRSTFGYSFVSVSEASESLSLWHSGHTIISGTPVNTGIASAPTATGTFPVYEHLAETTMSGTNPDGSSYSDPGIQFVSYFNGGDALHAFTRAQYGFPQSLGCVEMPLEVAGQVYPYTPIGTLVHVS